MGIRATGRMLLEKTLRRASQRGENPPWPPVLQGFQILYRAATVSRNFPLLKKTRTGNTVHVGIHPSKVQITKIKMDKDRKALLERKDRTRNGGKPAAGAADADVNMAGVD